MSDNSERKHQSRVETRVEYIADLMRNCRFTTGQTVKELAKEWDFTEQYVRELTAEASKRVASELENPDRVRAKIGSVLENIVEKAWVEGNYKDAINAGKVLAVLVGANAAHRAEMRIQHRLEQELPQDKESLKKILEEEIEKLSK